MAQKDAYLIQNYQDGIFHEIIFSFSAVDNSLRTTKYCLRLFYFGNSLYELIFSETSPDLNIYDPNLTFIYLMTIVKQKILG